MAYSVGKPEAATASDLGSMLCWWHMVVFVLCVTLVSVTVANLGGSRLPMTVSSAELGYTSEASTEPDAEAARKRKEARERMQENRKRAREQKERKILLDAQKWQAEHSSRERHRLSIIPGFRLPSVSSAVERVATSLAQSMAHIRMQAHVFQQGQTCALKEQVRQHERALEAVCAEIAQLKEVMQRKCQYNSELTDKYKSKLAVAQELIKQLQKKCPQQKPSASLTRGHEILQRAWVNVDFQEAFPSLATGTIGASAAYGSRVNPTLDEVESSAVELDTSLDEAIANAWKAKAVAKSQSASRSIYIRAQGAWSSFDPHDSSKWRQPIQPMNNSLRLMRAQRRQDGFHAADLRIEAIKQVGAAAKIFQHTQQQPCPTVGIVASTSNASSARPWRPPAQPAPTWRGAGTLMHTLPSSSLPSSPPRADCILVPATPEVHDRSTRGSLLQSPIGVPESPLQ